MTTIRLAKNIAYNKSKNTSEAAAKKHNATSEAAAKKYEGRGSSGLKQFGKEYDASLKKFGKEYDDSLKKFGEDHANVDLYGKDAMKGKGFATTGRPKAVNAGASRPATQSGTPKGK